MEAVDPFDRLAMLFTSLQAVRHVDPSNHQDAVVLTDLSAHISAEPSLICTDSARLQRASEGTG